MPDKLPVIIALMLLVNKCMLLSTITIILHEAKVNVNRNG